MNPSLNGNYIDLIIILILIYYASEAWRVGFWFILADFASFLGSILISLRAYKFVANFLQANFNLAHSVSNALGFIITSVILEAVLSNLFVFLITKIPKKIRKGRFLGIIPALGEGLILIAFILTSIVALPVQPSIKKDISSSKIGSFILKQTTGAEKALNEIFGGVVEDSLTYFTVKPGSKERVNLDNGIDRLSVDEASEVQMFKMVNDERTKRGVGALTWDNRIVVVARAYAKDMWERHYFSHYSPEGKDVGDRLDAAGVKYTLAGENLALAPTVQTAMAGLMNSEGHRANILEPKFRKVGIGVIDNGIYGKMFVQVFTD